MLDGWPLAAAFLVGIIALVALFKGRRTCRTCHRIFHAVLFWRADDLCPKCQTRTSGWTGERLARILLVLFFYGWLSWRLESELADAGRPHWLATLEAIAAAIGLFFASSLFFKHGRRAWGAWARFFARQFEPIDFRAARRASGHSGEVHRAAGFTLWTDAPGDWTFDVSTISARTAEEFYRLTGVPAKVSRPVRILCFNKEEAFSRYTAGMFRQIGRARGYYQGRLRKKVILFRDMPDLPPATFESILTHELAHHFTRCNLRARPLWLNEGLAELVSGRVGDVTVSDARAQRGLKAALARGQILTGKELFAASYRRLNRRMKDWRNLEDASYCGRLYGQSAALLAWLRRTDEEAFKRFLAGLARGRRWKRIFRSCFGLSPDEAVERWEEELRVRPLLPLPAVPPALEQRVREQLVRVAADTAATRDARLLAIRWLGGGGYLCGAEALIGILENPADDLRGEAQRALENMSGELLGADPAAWRRWMLSPNGPPPAAHAAV